MHQDPVLVAHLKIVSPDPNKHTLSLDINGTFIGGVPRPTYHLTRRCVAVRGAFATVSARHQCAGCSRGSTSEPGKS
jgi:hypothetical protein